MADPEIRVEIVWCEDSRLNRMLLALPPGSTIAAAIDAACRDGVLRETVLQACSVAVFGRIRPPGERLHDGDRIELVAALKVDPKIARQRRVAHRRAAQARDKWRGGR